MDKKTQYPTKTFEWECNSNKPVFPIDYSQRGLANLLNENPRVIKKYNLFEDNVLDDQFLNSAIISRKQIRPDRKKNGAVSFPVEGVPFFKCFYQLAVSDKYYDAFSDRTGAGPQEVPDGFVDDFCRSLRNEVKDDTKPGSKYCRNALYQDETFQAKALSDLWSQAVTPRYQRLLDKARTTEPAAQQHTLMRCITFLDQALVELRYHEQIPEKKPDLSALLSWLLRREQVKENTSCYACYLVPNSSFDDKGGRSVQLSDAFTTLNYKHKNNLDLLKQARSSYLSELDKTSRSSDFEATYVSIEEYLHFRNDPNKKELIEKLVQERCKQYCVAVFDRCRFAPDDFVPAVSETYTSLEYVAQLADYLVNAALTPDFGYYQPTIRLLTYLYMAYYAHEQTRLHTKAVLTQIGKDFDPIEHACPIVGAQENSTYQETLRFSALFSDMWKKLYGVEAFDSSTHRFLSLNATAQTIYRDATCAAAFFGCEKEYILFEPEEIRDMLRLYETIVSYPERFYSYANYLRFAPHLLLFVLLSVFKGIAEVKIPLITQDILHLFSSQTT